MIQFRIRGVLPSDQHDLLYVARHLNSVNLPHDAATIAKIVDKSVRSFSEKELDPTRAEYIFVLEDLKTHRVVGTSMVFGQLGRRDAPYVYFDVRSEEKYSSTLDKHFHHTVLRIGYSYNGPTEIGGIVLLPEYRLHNERLGQFLSYVRFLFIAMHRERFRDEILAELLPPLEPDGTSHLWEALGRHFTELSYAEADKLSRRNKEFVKTLFPDGDVYATLLPLDAQQVIGKVGLQSQGVEKLLTRIGFRYCERIDPFDGGPHFLANTDEITLVSASTKTTIVEIESRSVQYPLKGIIATKSKEPPYWLSVMTFYHEREDGIILSQHAAQSIDVHVGDRIMLLPLGPDSFMRSSKLPVVASAKW